MSNLLLWRQGENSFLHPSTALGGWEFKSKTATGCSFVSGRFPHHPQTIFLSSWLQMSLHVTRTPSSQSQLRSHKVISVGILTYSRGMMENDYCDEVAFLNLSPFLKFRLDKEGIKYSSLFHSTVRQLHAGGLALWILTERTPCICPNNNDIKGFHKSNNPFHSICQKASSNGLTLNRSPH